MLPTAQRNMKIALAIAGVPVDDFNPPARRLTLPIMLALPITLAHPITEAGTPYHNSFFKKTMSH